MLDHGHIQDVAAEVLPWMLEKWTIKIHKPWLVESGLERLQNSSLSPYGPDALFGLRKLLSVRTAGGMLRIEK